MPMACPPRIIYIGMPSFKLKLNWSFHYRERVFNYGFRDTSEYSFSESIDEIDSILVRANIINGFPIDAQVQVYLTDENYKITDSIFPGINENLIASGKINSKGRVSEPAKKVTDVKIQKRSCSKHHKRFLPHH